METLSAAETNAVHGAMVDAIHETWKRAASCYEHRMPALGDYWANRCLTTGIAYRKLIDWPNEPGAED